MAWYMNKSSATVAIPTGDSNVVAVRPNGKVEVHVETEEVLRLVRVGKIIRTGRPMQVPVRVHQAVAEDIAIKPSHFVQTIVAEKPLVETSSTSIKQTSVESAPQNVDVAALVAKDEKKKMNATRSSRR